MINTFVKLLKLTPLTLIFSNAYSGEIACDSLVCIPNNLTVKNHIDLNVDVSHLTKIQVSSIDDPSGNYLYSYIRNGTSPRDLNVFVDLSKRDPNSIYSIIPITKPDVTFDFSSNIFGYDSGNISLVSSKIGSLTLISNGKDGVDGISSSQLCAQWKNSNQGTNISKCTQSDVTAAYNSFSCPSGYTPSQTEIVSVSRYLKVRKCYSGQNYTYLDKNSNCSPGATDLGLVQDPGGATENVQCSFYGACDLTVEKKEYPQSLATFTPTAGTKAILAGNNRAFIYNYDTLTYSNYNGAYGIGGKADLAQYMPNPAIIPKYCYRKYDLNGAPSPDYFLNPYLSFFKINWQPFIEKQTASDGLPGVLKNGTTTVIKGLDSSVRYWLGNDMIKN